MESPVHSDSYLWAQFKEGDRSAYEIMYLKFYRSLYSYARRLLREEEEAKNQIQELFLTIWERRASLQDIESIKGYLMVALKRRIVRYLQVKSKDDFQYLDNDSEFDGFTFSPEDFLLKGEYDRQVKEQVVKAINELPPRLKEIIYLRYYDELSIQEIADALGLNYQSVSNHLQRAFSLLKNKENLKVLLLTSSIAIPFLLYFFLF